MSSSHEDAALVAAYRNGDDSAFETLYEHYVRRIFDFVYFKVHHKETAEDIVSQTFLQAFQRISSFDSERGVFSAWLHTIARNLVMDHFRARKDTQPIEDAWDLSDSTDVVRDADTALRIEKVREFLGTLSASQREVVLLRLWHGYSFAEIAEITGGTEASGKMAYHRALAKLKEQSALALLLLFFLPHS